MDGSYYGSPRFGDRVKTYLAGGSAETGIFLGNSGKIKGQPLWDVRRDDGVVITLVAAYGDRMEPVR